MESGNTDFMNINTLLHNQGLKLLNMEKCIVIYIVISVLFCEFHEDKHKLFLIRTKSFNLLRCPNQW